MDYINEDILQHLCYCPEDETPQMYWFFLTKRRPDDAQVASFADAYVAQVSSGNTADGYTGWNIYAVCEEAGQPTDVPTASIDAWELHASIDDFLLSYATEYRQDNPLPTC